MCIMYSISEHICALCTVYLSTYVQHSVKTWPNVFGPFKPKPQKHADFLIAVPITVSLNTMCVLLNACH